MLIPKNNISKTMLFFSKIWIVSCIGFVFLAVVEYFFLLCFARFDLKFAEEEKATAASSLFPVTKWWPAFPKMA